MTGLSPGTRPQPQPPPWSAPLDLVFGPPAGPSAPPLRPLAVYYGPADRAALAQFRRVIVQGGHHPPAEVEWLRSRGVQVLAYLSLGEDPGPGGSWTAGAALSDWHTRLCDLRDPAWTAQVRAQVLELCGPFDGLFLDGLEHAERDPAQAAAMRGLLWSVRRWAPGRYLLANRGLTFLNELRGVADGVLIESFSSTWLGDYRPYRPDELAYTAGLMCQARVLGLEICALDYARTEERRQFAQARADALGVPTFITDRALSLPGGLRPAGDVDQG